MGGYAAPTISAQGLSIPAYSAILADLLAQFATIYGQTAYLGTDSADYQFISAICLKISDTMQAIQLAYNARSPLTAVGADLDSIVKLNGMVRKSASFSTCNVTISGTSGTTITSGSVQDVNGFQWMLPSIVTIPSGGTISVTATAQNPGAINANPGDLSIIATPTAGWTSVTNPAAANAGLPIEADSLLRARQSLSVALPSRTMLAGTQAAIAATAGVTRYNILENPTGATDSYGNPPHSISCVVEGGTQIAVATAIYNNRSIGCYTNGTTSVVVTDPNTGFQMTISYFLPTYVPIFATLTIHGLTGYTSATLTAVQAEVVNYLNSLQIGEEITISALYGAALSVMPNLSLPQFSIKSLVAGISSGAQGTTDISLTFNSVAQGITANVSVTAV